MVHCAVPIVLVRGRFLRSSGSSYMRKTGENTPERGTMLELTSYRLTGLAAMLAIAFCFVCSDTFALILKKPFGLGGILHLNASPTIRTRTVDPRFTGRCDKQREGAPASLLQTAYLFDTLVRAVRCVNVKSRGVPTEASHG